jgi:glycosyltransferase involved in cell wall biosynthesis
VHDEWTNVAWRTATLRELSGIAPSLSLNALRRRALDGGYRVKDLGGAPVLRVPAELRVGVEAADHPVAVAAERAIVPATHRAGFVEDRTVPPLRLCLVSREYPPEVHGGIGRFTRDLAEGLAAEGHEVHVVTSTRANSEVHFERGVWVHRLAENPRFGLNRTDGAEIISRAVGVWHEIQRIVAWGPVDLVSAPLWDSEGLVCSLDGRIPLVTSLMTTHQTVISLSPSAGVARYKREILALEAATVARTRAVHALSHAILAHVKDEYSLMATEIVVPPGVPDRASGRPVQRRAGADVEVLFVGRLEIRKGVDVLLAAVESLLPAVPHLRLTLAGRDTATTATGETYRAAFERRARGRPLLQAAVRFLGPVDDAELDELYGRCDVFCAPSRYESFGLVLVEAMSYGKPVIGAAIGGMSEVVRDGVDGLLARPGDIGSLADCLRRLAIDPSLRSMMGRNARARYVQEFSVPVIARRTAAAYGELAAALHGGDQRADLAPALAEVLRETGLATGSGAQTIAANLLDPSLHPLDPLGLAEQLWDVNRRAFVEGLAARLAPSSDRDLRSQWIADLNRHGSRRRMLEAIAGSPEALTGGKPFTWLSGVSALPDDRRSRRAVRIARRRLRAGRARAAVSARYRSGTVLAEFSTLAARLLGR